MKEALKLALEALEHINDRFDLESVAQDATTAITAIKEALAQPNEFNPDWDAMAVMVEEQQRMAKRIGELEAQRERVVFPTMLRKMWSGGEVQAWLDENVNKEKNDGT